MNITQFQCNNYHVLSLDGAFDSEAVRASREHLESLVRSQDGGIIVDMSEVTFLDSSGIGALVFLFKRLSAEKRDMRMVGLNGQPARLVSLLRIDRTIKTATDLKTLVAASA